MRKVAFSMGFVNDWDRVSAAAIARRSEMGLTQKALAEKAGVAERTIQNLEAGKKPQPLIRGKVEKALGWPAGEMERIASAPQGAPEPEPRVPDDVRKFINGRYDRDAAGEIFDLLRQIGARAEREARAASPGEGRMREGGGASSPAE